MKCPYCGNEMISGYLQSARQVFFSPRKHKIMFKAEEGEIVLADEHFLVANCCDAQCCTECKRVIITYFNE